MKVWEIVNNAKLECSQLLDDDDRNLWLSQEQKPVLLV
jgi:gluconate kinase